MRQLLQPITTFVYCNRQAPPAGASRPLAAGCPVAESIMTDSVIFQYTCSKLLYFYFQLKSDVTIVFLDPDFLHGAGIPAIREHYRQKLAYLCLHGFSGILAQNGDF